MLDRKKFAEAAEKKYKTVKYADTDCQAFVEACAREAGYVFNSRGSNDMYRNYTLRKGLTADYNLTLGDIVWKWRPESSKLPTRYHGDGIGDMYHVGVVTAVGDQITVCHSSNSKENGKKDTFNSLSSLANTWQYAGTLKTTADLADDTDQPIDVSEAIKHLEAALAILKEI